MNKTISDINDALLKNRIDLIRAFLNSGSLNTSSDVFHIIDKFIEDNRGRYGYVPLNKYKEKISRYIYNVLNTKTIAPIGTKFDEIWRVTKVLLKLESGHKLWGTLPTLYIQDAETNILYRNIPKSGTKIKFTATIKPSEKDPAFAVFSHPRNAMVIEE